MLQGEHSAIHSTPIKLAFLIKTFVLSILSGRLRQVLLYIQLVLGGMNAFLLVKVIEVAHLAFRSDTTISLRTTNSFNDFSNCLLKSSTEGDEKSALSILSSLIFLPLGGTLFKNLKDFNFPMT